MSSRICPLQLNFNAGILQRLFNLLNHLNEKKPLIPQAKTVRFADMSQSIEDELLKVLDQETKPVYSSYKLDLDFIRIVLSFPVIQNGVA